jgi:hypothetical protein
VEEVKDVKTVYLIDVSLVPVNAIAINKKYPIVWEKLFEI